MFGAILTLAVTLMQGYVFWRAAAVPFVQRRMPRRYLAVLGIVLWVVFLLGRLLRPEDGGSLAALLEFLGMTWLGVLFLLFVSLLAVDLATGFGFFLPRFGPRLRGIALIAGGLLSVIALVQGLRAPVVQRYDVYLDRLPGNLDGTVIVILSDLHLGPELGERWLTARLAQAQAEQPDAVVLLGDIFEGHTTPGPELLGALHRLSAPLGVWGVLGNHEFHGNRSNNLALFESAGVHILANAWVEPKSGLILAGVEDLTYNGDPARTAASLAQALAGRPPGATILLSHAPLPADAIAGKGVDLMLSGHTHGGQIWPFGYLVRQRFPLLEGRYDFGGMTAIVSRGTGTWGPRMRLWHPAEIVRVTLHSSSKQKEVAMAAQ